MRHFLSFIVLILLTTPLLAEEANPLAVDPQLEVQVHRLSTELRCLVCQNQTLADSDAPLAEDLRVEIREMAAQGKSDQEIIDYLVARYGDFVLYRPPVKATTVLLWIGPFLLLVAGVIGLGLILRSRQKQIIATPLNIDESRKVTELLNSDLINKES
ncbi:MULTISPECIES: cytochrome c-type biogenesis protein [Methylotenera]|uniref:cytochrome c-type biogenesis protein n=1 Tax=Methylotenera TaxID=359407 RepID=UPI000365DBE2|nr:MULTISPECIES: cytochrome c-type biogenesis protein [Methylotenera]